MENSNATAQNAASDTTAQNVTEASTAQSDAASTSSDNGTEKLEARLKNQEIAYGRKEKKLNDTIASLEARLEGFKSEEEKRIEQMVDAKAAEIYTPKLEQLQRVHDSVMTIVDEEIAKLPEEARGLIDASSSPDVQLSQIRAAQTLLATQSKANTGGGSSLNPNTGEGSITWAEFYEWSEWAGSTSPETRKRYWDQKEKMQAAYRENRLVGPKPR